MHGRPRFVADAMLGSLAKWLRILGFDTLYFKSIDDNELIKIAKQEQRMLLTMDSGLVKKKKIDEYILITSSDLSEQLKEVLKSLPTASTSSCFFRCAECNGELASVGKEFVAEDVPEYVFLNFDSFFKCSNCGKVYWEGSHKRSISARLQEILKEIKNNN